MYISVLCTSYPDGAIVVYYLNIGSDPSTLSLGQFQDDPIYLFQLTPGDEEGMVSRYAVLLLTVALSHSLPYYFLSFSLFYCLSNLSISFCFPLFLPSLFLSPLCFLRLSSSLFSLSLPLLFSLPSLSLFLSFNSQSLHPPTLFSTSTSLFSVFIPTFICWLL